MPNSFVAPSSEDGAAPEPLDRAAVADQLTDLPDWALARNALSIFRRLSFRNLAEALRFMADVSGHAQLVDHHPEWAHSNNRVVLKLTTHSVRGLTARDFEFARHVDEVLPAYALAADW